MRLLSYVQAKALKINLPAANCGALAPTSLCLVKFWPQQAAGNEPVTDSRRITATSYQLFIDSSLPCICFFVNFFLYILFCIFFLYIFSVYCLFCILSCLLPVYFLLVFHISAFYIFQDSIYSRILYIPKFYIFQDSISRRSPACCRWCASARPWPR